MKRLLMVLIPALIVIASASAFAQDDAVTVLVAEDAALGAILTDAEGMTLYLFTQDTVANESACSGGCAENWPPFSPEGDLTLPDGVEGELTRFDREDGASQVAYNGIPLYYWVNDTAPGDTTGQGVGDVWYIVPPGQEFGAGPGTPEA